MKKTFEQRRKEVMGEGEGGSSKSGPGYNGEQGGEDESGMENGQVHYVYLYL
jgi:hypothetical protein